MTNRTFPLAGLLRLRSIEQDQAAASLSAANTRSRDLKDRTSAARQGLGAHSVDITDSRALHMAAIARASSASMLADLVALETVATEEAAAAQASFLSARSRTVGLEKLSARHTARVEAADQATEQTALDEISSAAHHRLKAAATA